MRRAAYLLFWMAMVNASSQADDLVTRDGTVYKNYKVMSHDAGSITIMYADGGGKVPLSQLPGELQKAYGYNPAAAAVALQTAADQDRRDKQALAAQQAAAQAPAVSEPTTGSPALAVSPAASGATAVSAALNGAQPTPTAPPAGFLTPQQLMETCDQIAELNASLAELSENNGRNYSDEKKIDQDQLKIFKHKLQVHEQLLAKHIIKGPRLSPAQLADLQQQIADTDQDLQEKTRLASETNSGRARDDAYKDEQLIYRLTLEINYAND